MVVGWWLVAFFCAVFYVRLLTDLQSMETVE